ncbi:MAG: hypothetical protein NT013_23745 [Planctomycetia bacterium]|nr:hypothetical protein [Planctomycetia bacterium]
MVRSALRDEMVWRDDRPWVETHGDLRRSLCDQGQEPKVAHPPKRVYEILVLSAGIYSGFWERDLTVWKPISRGLGGSAIICRRTSVMDLIWSSWKSTVSASLAIC